MKNNTNLIYGVFLVVGDFLALVGAFSIAYILRVSVSHVRIYTPIRAANYLETFLTLLPFFILLFALLGLYNKDIYERRVKEYGRLAVGVFIGVLFVISYGYVRNIPIFPARLVILYGYILGLLFVVAFRGIAYGIKQLLFRYNRGLNNVLIVGNAKITREIITSLSPASRTGYRVIGVVSDDKHPLKSYADLEIYADFDKAIEQLGGRLHTIIQTEIYSDQAKNSIVLTYAQEHHIAFRFVPINSELFVGNLGVEVFQGIPLIDVHQTAIIGWGRVVKRTTDLIIGSLMLLVCSPLMVLISLLIILGDSRPVFFRQTRLTRYNQKFEVYKFRTHKREFNGLSPEKAFQKLGRPDLARTYRRNGDYVDNDPRISSLGRLLRKTSLDELPQLINVVKGDISLVGPRPLVPEELEQYTKRHAILSVRSGLTGLAQVSGRRDITFDERRQLDLYYVQNWTFWNDLFILIKTLWVIVIRQGSV